MTPSTARPPVFASLLAVWLIAAGCSADEPSTGPESASTDPPTAESTAPESTTTTTTPSPPDSSPTVPDLAWREVELGVSIDSGIVTADGSAVLFGSPTTDGAPGQVYRWAPDTESLVADGALAAARRMPMVVELGDGRVLLAGGLDLAGNVLATAEVYDPTAGESTVVAPMATPRARGKSAQLPDGGAIVTGGTSVLAIETNPAATLAGGLATTEIFDPITETWSAGPDMASTRVTHAMAETTDGRVLIAGGLTSDGAVPSMSATAEIYDPASNTLSAAPDLPMGGRGELTLSPLDDGTVLVSGGGGIEASPEPGSDDGPGFAINAKTDAAIFDPDTGTWTSVGAMDTARAGHHGFSTENGLVVVGGDTGSMLTLTPTAEVERFDHATNSWEALPPLPSPLVGYTGFVTAGGETVIVGGSADRVSINTTAFILGSV